MAPLGSCLDGGCPSRLSCPEVCPGPVVTGPGICYPSESGVTSGVRGRRSVRRVRARVRLELLRTSVVPCPLGKPRWRMMVSLPPQVPLPVGGARDVLAGGCPGRDEVIASAGVLSAWYGPLSTAAVAPEDPADLVPSGPLAGPSDAARLRPAVLRNRLVTCRYCRGRQRPLRTAGWVEGITSRCPPALQPTADQIRV
jgi:hypothetical protein